MAKGRDILDENITKLTTGTATDYSPEEQPAGVSSFVLNGINQSSSGDKNKRITEQSNAPCGSITSGYVPNGKGYTTDGRNVLFSVSLDETTSEIGIVDKNCVYTPIINTKVLGFTLNHQIQCIYRLRLGCEDVIYFTDGNQSIKNFNFARPQDYYTPDYIAFLATGFGTFTGEKWDADKFNLFPAYKVPDFTSLVVSTGGAVVPGTYNFSIRYLDQDLNPTNWIYNSQLVSIFQSDNTGDYNNITGSSNISNDSLAGIVTTTKSIQLSLGNLDNTYKYYQIAVIQATSGTGNSTKILASPQFPITQLSYIFNGNLDGYTEITQAELSIGKIDIDTVQHLEQLENRLILSNVAGKKVPYCTFQQSASQIVSNYVIREVPNSGALADGNAKDPNTYWDQEGYMGDEVYAMGIVYVFNDGLETPAFHIPGRSPSEYMRATDKSIQTTGDQTVISVWTTDLEPWYQDAATYNALPSSLKLKRWQVYDTSVSYSPGGITESFGAMSYWENKDSTYTNFSDCGGGDFWGTDACGVSLLNKPIRHHKFPSRYKEPHVRGGSIFTGKTGLYYDVTLNPGQTFPGGGLTLIISYELNGSPNTYTVTINASDLPIERFLVDQFDGDFSTINIVSVTGTLTDPGNAAISTYSVYRDVLSSSTTNDTILRNLGIQFSNITYPHPDIVGHYFVRGSRDNQNRTILDKGFAGKLRQKTVSGIAYNTFSYFTGDFNEDTNNNYLFTPRFLFNKESLTGDYLRYENEFTFDTEFVSSDKYDGIGSIFKEFDTVIETREQSYNGVDTAHGDHNYKVDKSIILDATTKNTTFDGPSQPLYDLSWSNRLHVVKTHSGFPRYTAKNIPYVAYKIDQNVHPTLSNIVYQRTHNSILIPQDDNIVFGGDTFISDLYLCNSLYRKQQKGFLTAILSIILIAAGVILTIATAGVTSIAIAAAVSAASSAGIDAAIVVTALVAGAIGVTGTTIQALTGEINGDLSQLTDDSEFEAATGSGGTLIGYAAYSNEFLQGIFVESEVNVGLRQMENQICGNFYNYSDSIQDYFKNRWMYFDQTHSAYLPKGYCCPEVYHYNPDYSRQNLQSQYFPLPDTYNCCSDCDEEHPDRNYYSEQSFQEELTDNYKIVLPNNYVDIEGEHGVITNIIKRNNNLFIFTSESIYMLPESQQEKVTDELVTYIGTGDFFSIPPKKITDSELGSGGSQHKWATLSLTQGLLFVNELEGKIFLFNQSFKEISAYGHKRWFKENLQDFFARQFQQTTNTPFPNTNNPANPHGVGIHAVYDERYERILITKKDYKLLPQFVSSFRTVVSVAGVMPTLTSGQLVFDLTTNKFVVSGGSPTVYTFTEFTNPAFFENKSWTMSFSPEDETWISWHSYLPNFYFYTHREFYSTIFNSNSLWKHNQFASFLSFYGISYPHIVEMILKTNPTDTRYWDDISLQTIAKKYDTSNQQWYEQQFVTFNKLIGYNTRQATGQLNLIVKDNSSDLSFLPSAISQSPNNIFITRKERDWNLNDLRDYRTDYSSSLFTKNWSQIKALYPIDKIIDITNIDPNKDWTQLEVLRDKFIILRFIFDNFTDTQLETNYILDTSGESMR